MGKHCPYNDNQCAEFFNICATYNKKKHKTQTKPAHLLQKLPDTGLYFSNFEDFLHAVHKQFKAPDAFSIFSMFTFSTTLPNFQIPRISIKKFHFHCIHSGSAIFFKEDIESFFEKKHRQYL